MSMYTCKNCTAQSWNEFTDGMCDTCWSKDYRVWGQRELIERIEELERALNGVLDTSNTKDYREAYKKAQKRIRETQVREEVKKDFQKIGTELKKSREKKWL